MSDIIERLYGDEIREAVKKAAIETEAKVRKKCRINFVLKLLSKGLSKDLVSKYTDVPVYEIDEIIANKGLTTSI